MNRLQGIDLVDRVSEEIWMNVHNIVQEVVIKTILKGISPGCSLEELMLKLKLQYFGHLM